MRAVVLIPTSSFFQQQIYRQKETITSLRRLPSSDCAHAPQTCGETSALRMSMSSKAENLAIAGSAAMTNRWFHCRCALLDQNHSFRMSYPYQSTRVKHFPLSLVLVTVYSPFGPKEERPAVIQVSCWPLTKYWLVLSGFKDPQSRIHPFSRIPFLK